MAQIIDGRAVAARIREQVRRDAAKLPRQPGLAVVLVGDDAGSRAYFAGKERDCRECGLRSFAHLLPAETTQGELLALIGRLNDDERVDGILLQLPLPEQIDRQRVLRAISPEKDVDGVHPLNAGLLAVGAPRFLPCTPAGVVELLRAYDIPVGGKRCVVVGRSDIVGKPMARLLLALDGTVTVCHSRTADLAEQTRQADILVAAAGRPGLIAGDMVKDGAVVVDVAMNRGADGRLCGDVDFAAVEKKASYITPVPGGTGPVTRAILLRNLLQAAGERQGRA